MQEGHLHISVAYLHTPEKIQVIRAGPKELHWGGGGIHLEKAERTVND